MRLTQLYFCYGSILTSVLWLSMIIVYFSVQEKQILSLYHDQMISDENVVSERQSRQLITRSNMSSLPDLDRLAIIHSHQDKLLRAEGDSRSLLALV